LRGKHCDDALHGMTVVVETPGSRVYLGRYHSADEEAVLLLDAEVRELDGETSREEFLARSAKLGVFRTTDRVRIPHAEVRSIRRLIEYRRTEEP
jgi:hypothetical protein